MKSFTPAGKYDNYDNRARIKACEKKLAKLKRKRKPDQFEIDQAQKKLEEAKLFQSCQIFKSSFGESLQDPNDNGFKTMVSGLREAG